VAVCSFSGSNREILQLGVHSVSSYLDRLDNDTTVERFQVSSNVTDVATPTYRTDTIWFRFNNREEDCETRRNGVYRPRDDAGNCDDVRREILVPVDSIARVTPSKFNKVDIKVDMSRLFFRARRFVPPPASIATRDTRASPFNSWHPSLRMLSRGALQSTVNHYRTGHFTRKQC